MRTRALRAGDGVCLTRRSRAGGGRPPVTEIGDGRCLSGAPSLFLYSIPLGVCQCKVKNADNL